MTTILRTSRWTAPGSRALEIDGVGIDAVHHATDCDELSLAMAEAFMVGSSVIAFGESTRMELGNPPARVELAVCLSRLRAIVDYDPGNLVVKAQAGAKLRDLRELAAGDSLVLPVGRAATQRGTLGGCLATNDHHLMRSLYGRVKDSVLGITAALANGDRVHFGGRVVKNVSGYDVGKLFLGSLGTLGVIIECELRLRPAPLAEAALLVPMRSSEGAADTAMRIGDSPLAPAALQIISASYLTLLPRLQSLVPYPNRPAVLTLFEGHGKAVARQLGEALGLCGDRAIGGHLAIVPEADHRPDVRAKTTDKLAQYTELQHEYGHVALMRELEEALQTAKGTFDCAAAFSVSLSAVEPLVALLEEAAGDDVAAAYRVDCGVGTGEILVRGRGSLAYLRRVRAACEAGSSGNLTLLWGRRALDGDFDAWGTPPGSFGLLRRIKTQMDPKNMMSPGRHVGGI